MRQPIMECWSRSVQALFEMPSSLPGRWETDDGSRPLLLHPRPSALINDVGELLLQL